jgi:hypothetical protein
MNYPDFREQTPIMDALSTIQKNIQKYSDPINIVIAY